MSLKHAALGGLLLALCAGFNAAPAEAQAVNCVDLYNRVLAAYRAAPFSPEYNQIAAAYGASCLAGAAAAPAYYPPNSQPPYAGYPEYPGYPADAAYPDYDYGYYGVPLGLGIGFGYGRGFRGGGFHGGFHGGRAHGGGSFHGGGHGGRH